MFKLCGLLLTGFLVGLAASLFPATAQTKGSGSISGRVTLGEKPAKGVPIVATSSASPNQKPTSVTASTDDEGRYRITGLAAGRYSVSPYQPANVLPERTQWDPGSKSVTLGDDESVSDINFSLMPGGVITGRIVGPDGRPLIEQRVTVESIDKKTSFGGFMSGSTMYQTDDRGIYRVYGLPSGRYLVSIGEDKNNDTISLGFQNGGYFQKTFYPSVTERSDARVVELTEGAVETGIDIVVGPREKRYSIAGRMIDQATGKAVADVPAAYGVISPGQSGIGASGTDTKSDALGQFKLNSLKPGRYAVFAGGNFMGTDKWTSDPVQVEITDADITG